MWSLEGSPCLRGDKRIRRNCWSILPTLRNILSTLRFKRKKKEKKKRFKRKKKYHLFHCLPLVFYFFLTVFHPLKDYSGLVISWHNLLFFLPFTYFILFPPLIHLFFHLFSTMVVCHDKYFIVIYLVISSEKTKLNL